MIKTWKFSPVANRCCRCPLTRVGIVPLLVLLAALLGGCASTDDLYANYDAESCPVIASATPERVVLRDRVTAISMHWEPAVYFEFDLEVLGRRETTRLDQDLLVLKRYPLLRLAVRGFTDYKGGDDYNKALAQRRVTTVSQYLISKGLHPSRLESVALGEGLPILSGTDDKSRAIHRRVELLLLDGLGRPLPHALDLKKATVLAAAVDKSPNKHKTPVVASQATTGEEPTHAVKPVLGKEPPAGPVESPASNPAQSPSEDLVPLLRSPEILRSKPNPDPESNPEPTQAEPTQAEPTQAEPTQAEPTPLPVSRPVPGSLPVRDIH